MQGASWKLGAWNRGGHCIPGEGYLSHSHSNTFDVNTRLGESRAPAQTRTLTQEAVRDGTERLGARNTSYRVFKLLQSGLPQMAVPVGGDFAGTTIKLAQTLHQKRMDMHQDCKHFSSYTEATQYLVQHSIHIVKHAFQLHLRLWLIRQSIPPPPTVLKRFCWGGRERRQEKNNTP
mgnify:CR=1 FL=1